MADDAQSAADSSAYQQVGTRNPVGCATPSKLIENAADLPLAGPFSHDAPTKRLHNPTDCQELNSSDRWVNRDKGVYTKRLHIVRTHLVLKRGRIHYRRRVPDALQGIIGKQEIWRSLGTDSPTVAKRRALRVAAQIEHEFEVARSKAGLIVDPIVLDGLPERTPTAEPLVEMETSSGITFSDLYDAYMNDPTRDWSPTTRMAYQTTKRLVVAILGKDTPARSITRTQCREMIEVLRWQPRNASKLFPKLNPVEIAERAKAEQRTDLINAANINTYLNKLGGWTTASGAASVSDAYGSGYRIATLKEAIDRVRYTGLDLSHLYEQ